VSGIAGVLWRRGAPRTEERARRLENMLARMRFRGPDRSAVRLDAEAELGQCTLETTPEDALDTPPVVSPGGRVSIVADARLDNREELARGLDLSEAELAACSDAALLSRAYERWGRASVLRLLGDFAFVAWDEERRELVCARDAFGVRPLYYHVGARAFRCASDMQALLTDPDVPLRPHRESVGLRLLGDYHESGQTLYEGIFAVPAAHLVVADAARVRVERFWSPDRFGRLPPRTDDEYARELRALVTEAVRSRLRSRGQVAAVVSGGVDSSSVAGEAERLRRLGLGPTAPLLVAHIAFPGTSEDETPFSRGVARLWSLPTLEVCPLASAETMRPAPVHGHRDVWYDPRACMYTPLWAGVHARGVRAVLTGDGGDLVMTPGYAEIADHLLAGRPFAALGRSALARRPLARYAWQELWQCGIKPVVPESVRALARPLRRRNDPILTPDLHRRLVERSYACRRARLSRPFGSLNGLHLCAAIEEGRFHPELSQFERLAATAGVELRHPLLDRRIIEFQLALPPEQRHVPGLDKPKPVVRRAMRDVLPPEVLARPRSGDYVGMMREAMVVQHGRAVVELFARSRLVEAGVITPEAARDVAGWFDTPAAESLGWLRLSALVGMEIWLQDLP
jgi:asparagine synthase (glutamine-hydrolysing)